MPYSARDPERVTIGEAAAILSVSMIGPHEVAQE